MPSAAASTAPSTTSPGALSPPSASTAIRGIRVSLRTEPERLDLTATIGAAGRADAVRALRRAALRASVDARRLERVLGTALVAARLRRLSLRNGHRRRSVAVVAVRAFPVCRAKTKQLKDAGRGDSSAIA